MGIIKRLFALRCFFAVSISFLLSLFLIIALRAYYGQVHTAVRHSPFAGVIVCLDPGHPTEFNSGMHHVNGLREVDMNWQVALKVRKELERKGIRVVLTKDRSEQLVSNPRRSIIANQAKASLMVRLHCDAGPGKGYTVYYPNKMGYDGKKYGPVKKVRAASRIAAYRIRSGMNHHLSGKLNDRGVRGESTTRVGEWKGALRGSVYVDVPVVTIEMVFLNNASDAEFIRTDSGQNLMAKAVADGIILALGDPGVMLGQ